LINHSVRAVHEWKGDSRDFQNLISLTNALLGFGCYSSKDEVVVGLACPNEISGIYYSEVVQSGDFVGR